MVATRRQVGVHRHGPGPKVESRLVPAVPAAGLAGPVQDACGVCRRGILRHLQGRVDQRDDGWRIRAGGRRRGHGRTSGRARPGGRLPRRDLLARWRVPAAIAGPQTRWRSAPMRLGRPRCASGSSSSRSSAAAQCSAISAAGGSGAAAMDDGHLTVQSRRLARDEACADRVGDERVAGAGPLGPSAGASSELGVQLAQPGDRVDRDDLGQLACQQWPVGNPERSGDRPAVRTEPPQPAQEDSPPAGPGVVRRRDAARAAR